MDIFYLLSLSVTTITVFVLFWMKRPISYNNQLPKLWYSKVQSSESSQHLFDMYSWTHISHGILFYFLTLLILNCLGTKLTFFKLSFFIFIAILIEATWEIIENSDYIIKKYRSQTVSFGYFGDSIMNSIGDLLCCTAGVVIAYHVPIWASLGYLMVSEIALAVLIKDNLFLNLIMLVYPIKSIKTWQSG